jgi:transposase
MMRRVPCFFNGIKEKKRREMLSKKEDSRHQIEFVSIDQLVPKDHLLRKIERVIDFSFIYDLVKDKYSKGHGRPSIEPVVLIKIFFIQHLFGILSMRKNCPCKRCLFLLP